MLRPFGIDFKERASKYYPRGGERACRTEGVELDVADNGSWGEEKRRRRRLWRRAESEG
jgi:hypothetical protein